MTAVVAWLDAVLSNIPLPLLEVWGRFSYIVGLFLAICAFGGFTFRIGEHWGFGRARQTWDAKAFLSVPLTFVLIIASGYIGSFIVLVPGAQTFESLKDLAVLLCIVLFGYPALIAVAAGLHAVGPDRGGAAGLRAELGGGLFLLGRLCLDGLSAHRPESGFPPGADVAPLRRVRRVDHAVRSGDVGFHLLGQIHLRHLLPQHLVGAVLHVDRHLAPGARGLSGRPAAGQTVRMVLGGNPRTRQRTRDREQRMDLGIGPRRGAGRRGPGAGRPADPDLHLHAVHRAGARDGRRHGDCRASERRR